MMTSSLLPKLGLAFLLAAMASTHAAAPASEGVTVEASGPAKDAPETPAQRDARMAWWRDAKFGMFIHWGVYAVPAGKYGDKNSYGEWIMQSAKIPVATYQEFAKSFNPVKYDPVAWARIAKEAGMGYMVITSKHHDGFALFPSDASKWNIRDATPYQNDLLGPLVKAAKADGLKIGFYYSQSQDWNNPGGAKAGFQEGEGWDDAHKGNYDTYLKDVAVPQVKELLSRYPIDILWWDTPMHMDTKRAEPFAALAKQHPGLIMNNRLGGGFSGDTATPEQFVPVTGYPGDWETCMTLNGHWGFNAADVNWKSSSDLIRKLADICSKGGNFLLNIGPTAEGEFPQACIDRLREVGQWLKANGDSIYGTKAGPFAHLSWGCATSKGNRLYLHVFDWPKDGKLRVPLNNDAKAAWLLTDPDKKLAVTREPGRLVISLPAAAPDPVDSVVVLDLAGAPAPLPLLTAGASVTASATKPGNPAENVLDGTGAKRWIAPGDVKSASLEIALAQPQTVSGFGLDEPDVWPRMKQAFTLEAQVDGAWKKIAEGKTNGHGVIQSIAPVTAQQFRLTLDCEKGGPGVAEFQLYQPE